MAAPSKLRASFLKQLRVFAERTDRKAFPFDTLEFLTASFSVEFKAPITIIVGENGSGKSTLIEALAVASGFNVFGGSQHHRGFGADGDEPNALGAALRLSWLPRVRNGFFLCAESFFSACELPRRDGQS